MSIVLHIPHALDSWNCFEYNNLENIRNNFYFRFFNLIIINAGATKYIPKLSKIMPIP